MHGVFVPGVSENKGFLEYMHHKTYLATAYKEAMSDCSVSLVNVELLEADGTTQPTVDYAHAQRKKGKPSKRSRGEPSSSPPAGSQGRPRNAPSSASPPCPAAASQAAAAAAEE